MDGGEGKGLGGKQYSSGLIWLLFKTSIFGKSRYCFALQRT